MMRQALLKWCSWIGRLFPRDMCKRNQILVHSAGLSFTGEEFFGVLVLLSLFLSFFVASGLILYPDVREALLFTFSLSNIDVTLVIWFVLLWCVLLPIVFAVLYLLMRSLLHFLADERTMRMEYVLADFLTLISSNIRSGMPLDQAMWHAARPEFGVLSKEVRWHIKQAFSGEPLDDALKKLAGRFDSKLFKRALALLTEAEHSGGEVADVLDMTAQEVRRVLTTRKEISAMLVTYEIFVLFAAVIGTPFLFAVVCKLLQVLEKSFSALPHTTHGLFGFLKPSSVIVRSSDFFFFALTVIFMTALSSSAIISIIKYSKKSQAIKYFPFILIGAFAVFFFTLSLLNSFLSTFVM